jgi:hypothetical protein
MSHVCGENKKFKLQKEEKREKKEENSGRFRISKYIYSPIFNPFRGLQRVLELSR